MSLGKKVVVVVVGSGQGVRNRRTRGSGDRVQSHDSKDKNSKILTTRLSKLDHRCIHADRLS